MDLSTIKEKLDLLQYEDPWDYIADVYLIFENAWLHKRPKTKIHRSATKVINFQKSKPH